MGYRLQKSNFYLLTLRFKVFNIMQRAKSLFLYFNIIILAIEILFIFFLWFMDKYSFILENIILTLIIIKITSFIICLLIIIIKYNPIFAGIALSHFLLSFVSIFSMVIIGIEGIGNALSSENLIKTLEIQGSGKNIKIYEIKGFEPGGGGLSDIRIEAGSPYHKTITVIQKIAKPDTIHYFKDSLIVGTKNYAYIRCHLKTGKYKIYNETGKKLLE